jgi:predicted DNA-binding transcriptional regulator YafY
VDIGDVSTVAHLDLVFRAIVERRTLSFDYRGETRLVEPHHLGFERARWYLVGRDRDREARRVFRLDRIESEPRLGEPAGFEPPATRESLRIEPWRYGDADPVVARVEVDAAHLPDLLRRVGAEALTSPADTEPAMVEFEVRDRAAFRHLILGFGATVRVTEPAELVDLIVDWVEAAAR